MVNSGMDLSSLARLIHKLVAGERRRIGSHKHFLGWWGCHKEVLDRLNPHLAKVAITSGQIEHLLRENGYGELQPYGGFCAAAILNLDLEWAQPVRQFDEDQGERGTQSVIEFKGVREYEMEGIPEQFTLLRIPTVSGHGVWVLNHPVGTDLLDSASITQQALNLRKFPARHTNAMCQLSPPFDIEVETNVAWLLHSEVDHVHHDGDYSCCPTTQRITLRFTVEGLQLKILTSLSPLADPPKAATTDLGYGLFVFVTLPDDEQPTIPLASLYIDTV